MLWLILGIRKWRLQREPNNGTTSIVNTKAKGKRCTENPIPKRNPCNDPRETEASDNYVGEN